MTDRIVDPQVVCPFVALDEDRDHRAPGPDHHHRCFAESPAAPRALAHQAAYCLSGAFATCPTFVDWARREAAPARVDPPGRSLRDAGSTRPAAVPLPPPPADRPASRSGGSAADWTAPPPWGMAAGAAAGAAAGTGGATQDDADGPAATADGAGAGIDDADVEPVDAAASPGASADAGDAPLPPDDTPAFLVGRPSRPAPVPAWDEDDAWRTAGGDDDVDLDAGEPARIPVAAPRRMPVGYAPVAAGKGDRRAGSSRRGRVDAAAPSWEEPRHFEEYPALKSRRGAGIPRIALYALVVLLVGAGLFIAPSLLKGIGGGGEQSSPTPAPSSSVVPSVAPSPTAVPTPEQVVHTVKSGETLSAIGAIYGVTVDEILAANPSITDPNKIAVGDKIVIPQPLPSEIVDVEITPAP